MRAGVSGGALDVSSTPPCSDVARAECGSPASPPPTCIGEWSRKVSPKARFTFVQIFGYGSKESGGDGRVTSRVAGSRAAAALGVLDEMCSWSSNNSMAPCTVRFRSNAYVAGSGSKPISRHMVRRCA